MAPKTLDRQLDPGSGDTPQKADGGSKRPFARSYHWITPAVIRIKNPAVDLKRKYRKVFGLSLGTSILLQVGLVLLLPTFDFHSAPLAKSQVVVQMQDIPETHQIQRPPPPPRPAVPIATENADVPDDVTIGSTSLDLNKIPVSLPPPPPLVATQAPQEQQILDFWEVEKKPQLIKQVMPVYPEVARRAGMDGIVFLKYVVGADGRVRDVSVIKGPVIFRQAAINALSDFVYKPAIQNEQPVAVWMTIPIRFNLSANS